MWQFDFSVWNDYDKECYSESDKAETFEEVKAKLIAAKERYSRGDWEFCGVDCITAPDGSEIEWEP